MSTLLLVGDSRTLLDTLPANSVQCVVTSPPYYKLRQYLSDDDPNKVFEIGQERTPADYIANLVGIFRCIRRVLHPTGVAFLNLGDSHVGGGKAFGLRPKNLLMMPSRVGIALQDDDWILRSHIAWTKSNPMTESIKDRPTSAWESVFLLSKEDRYFWDYEGVREPASPVSIRRVQQANFANQKGGPKDYGTTGVNPSRSARKAIQNFAQNPGRNMHNVWPISVVPYPGAHTATFPLELPLRAIRAATSEAGCCPACRAPYRRILEVGEADLERQRACGGDVAGEYAGQATKDYATVGAQNASDVKRRILAGMRKKTTVGWAPTCACPPRPPVPCLVLDPFGGSGTTVAAAEQLGRDGIMIDLNLDSAMLARDRLVKARRQRRPQDQGT